MTTYSEASPIINSAWLEEWLDNTAVNVIEECSEPDDTIHRAGHIPSAIRFSGKSFAGTKAIGNL